MNVVESSSNSLVIKKEPSDDTVPDFPSPIVSSREGFPGDFMTDDNAHSVISTETRTKMLETDNDFDSQESLILRFKPLTDQHESGKDSGYSGFGIESTPTEMVKQHAQLQSGSKICVMDSDQYDAELNRNQNPTEVRMPKLIRMVPESVSNENVFSQKLNFIKTEDGQMHCLNCHSILKDIETHQMHCLKRIDENNADFYTKAVGGKPENSAYCSPVSMDQQSRSSEIKLEPLDTDSFYPEIKIEPVETNAETDTSLIQTKNEELMECPNCKLFFNDRCAYLDHKLYTCRSVNSNQTADKDCSGDVDNSEADGTYIKTEIPVDHHSEYDETSIKMEIPIDHSSPLFTCSCPNCKANFDDFVSLSIHRKDCKRQQIGTVVEELNLRKTTCAVCKEKFKSKLELSKHMVRVHIASDVECGSKKRKQPEAETDAADDTEQTYASLARGTKRHVKFRCNFDDCIEKFHTLAEFKAHYEEHLQNVGSNTETVQHDDVIQKVCKLIKSKEELETLKTETHGTADDISNKKAVFTKQPGIEEKIACPSQVSEEVNESADVHHCPIEGCANSFDSSTAVNRHLQLVHGKTKSENDLPVHQCQNKGCGLLFETKELLKKHIQDTHMVSNIPKLDFPDFVQYVCSVCFRVFQDLTDVKQHLKTAHDVKDNTTSNLYIVEKMILCKMCHSYIDSEKFLEHFKRCQKHYFIKTSLNKPSLEANQFYEITTDSGYTKINHLAAENSHERSDYSVAQKEDYPGVCKDNFMKQRSIVCKTCNNVFVRKSSLLTHLIKTHDVLNNLPSLENCSKDMVNWISEIKQHASLLEQKPKTSYCCDFKDCGLKFKTKTTLEQHNSEHFEKTCRFCNFKYYKDSDYNVHLNIHERPTISDQIKRKCALCNFCYSKTEDYKSHLLSHYNELKSKVQKDGSSRQSEITFYCQFNDCTAQFENIADLVVHESKYHTTYYSAGSGNNSIVVVPKQHQNDGTPVDTAAESRNCNFEKTQNSGGSNSPSENRPKEECDSTDTKRLENEISKSHNEVSFQTGEMDTKQQHDCHLCSTSFPSQQLLFSHLTLIHRIVFHKCRWDNCDAVFATASGLKLHVKSHIPGVQVSRESTDINKSCPLCAFQCSSEEIYNQHLSDYHKYSVITVKNPNAEKTGLNKGLDLDYNLLPYKCTVKGCSKAYLYHRDFIKHLQTKDHEFPCSVQNCSSSFEYPRALTFHLRHQHGVRIPQSVSAEHGVRIPQSVSAEHGVRIPQSVSTEHGVRIPQSVSTEHGVRIPQSVSTDTSANQKTAKIGFKKGPEIDKRLLPYKCPAKGCYKFYFNKTNLNIHYTENHKIVYSEQNLNSSYASTKANRHTVKEPQDQTVDKETDNKLVCTASGFQIELVDDSKS